MPVQLPIFYDYVFPNYCLPNALITELALVNYLHSLNSNRLRPHSFFEQSLNTGTDSNNLLTFMFDRSLGTFPNSTGGTGTHLTSEMYHEIVDCKEEALALGKRTHQKYIYPIRMSPHINDFSGFTSPGSKLNGEYFWKHMSAEALQDAQQGNAIILLDFAQENFIERNAYERLHDCLKLSGIPHKVVLAFNSFNARELYEKWFSPEERLLEVRNWPFVLCNTSYYYFRNNNTCVNPMVFKLSKAKIRDNYYLFKIRRPRPYRQALLFKLHADNLLAQGDWSWLENTKFDRNQISNIIHSYNLSNVTEESVEQLFQKFPHSLKDEPNGTFDNISSWTDRKFSSYQNSYFYICTETYTHGEYKSVTEKVCKPMVNFMPFLFMSFPGALQLLRDLGFKTFSPFIDESYDLEQDESKRLAMIYSEVKRLCSMSKQEIHDWYWSMQDIFMHNHSLILNFYKEDKYTHELVNYLHDRIKN